ncbi:MAG: hypothetical protein ACFUZC_22155 [Chthoniobacteraceae bacterium]
MKRIPLLLLAAAALNGMVSGCCSTCHRYFAVSCPPLYQRVVLADVEGCWISEYIAEGPITETCEDVCFRAMQRRIFKPCVLTFKYPLGRPVIVKGSNIIITPATKPLWLCQMDKTLPPENQCSREKRRLFQN